MWRYKYEILQAAVPAKQPAWAVLFSEDLGGERGQVHRCPVNEAADLAKAGLLLLRRYAEMIQCCVSADSDL